MCFFRESGNVVITVLVVIVKKIKKGQNEQRHFCCLMSSTLHPLLSLFTGTMRRRRQTIKSREALFSIWYLPCEEGRHSALPEASTPSLRCSRHLETCLSFCDAYTERTHRRHTATGQRSHPAALQATQSRLVERVRSGSTCVSQKCVGCKHFPPL